MLGMLVGDVLGVPFNDGKKLNGDVLIKYDPPLMIGKNAYALNRIYTFSGAIVQACAAMDAMFVYWKTDSVAEFKTAFAAKLRELMAHYKEKEYEPALLKWAEDGTLADSQYIDVVLRALPIGRVADSIEDAISLAKACIETTHDNPEALKAGCAVAEAAYRAVRTC